METRKCQDCGTSVLITEQETYCLHEEGNYSHCEDCCAQYNDLVKCEICKLPLAECDCAICEDCATAIDPNCTWQCSNHVLHCRKCCLASCHACKCIRCKTHS